MQFFDVFPKPQYITLSSILQAESIHDIQIMMYKLDRLALLVGRINLPFPISSFIWPCESRTKACFGVTQFVTQLDILEFRIENNKKKYLKKIVFTYVVSDLWGKF